jgi:putative hydrolase of the HAD superfamily
MVQVLPTSLSEPIQKRSARRAQPAATPAIQAIVSDLGQVILPFDVERAWSAIIPRCSLGGPEVRRLMRQALEETRLGCGAATGAEFHRCLVERAGLRLSLEEFRVAWSDMFWVDEEVVGLIERAPVRARILLSNTNELHWSWITERYPEALRHFDRLLVSHECRCEKPDPRIYRMAIEATGLPPEAHLFIDDIEENVQGARAVGMRAHLHTGADSLRELFARLRLLRDPD